jgi:hypothetical protein
MSSHSPAKEVAMSDEADHTRRWLLNASGAAILSSAIPGAASFAQTAATPAPAAAADSTREPPIAPATNAFADYVVKALDRELPAEVVARTKLHVLDTLAAEISPPATWTASAASPRRW